MIKTNNWLSVLFVLIFFSIPLTAQEQNCQFEEINKEYIESHPTEKNRMKTFEQQVKKRMLQKGKGLNQAKVGPYIIPVVFHIYGAKYPDNPRTGAKRNITDEKVIQSMASINADFKGFNDPVDNSFSNIEGGMNIEFRLAQVDPNGNTTTGIIYHEKKEGFGLQTNDEEIAKYAWDNYKYMNVHIQEIINSGSDTDSGIAWFPYKNMSDAGIARVVYNGKYMIYAPPASSLTHEFGHWLGLHHTFNGGCVSGGDKGDKVADTPPTTSGAATGAGSTCNTGVKNCFGNLINHQNHMDYNPCESMFTKGQVTRMESFMTHDARKTLWTPANLAATGTNQADIGARVIFTFQKSDDSAVDQALAFIEGFANNDGSILSKKRIKAVSGAKFAVTGQMQEGVHFSTTGVPNGLSTKITVEDNENAIITFTGNATNHTKSDSKEITITLLNPAIVGGVSSLFSKTGIYDMNFIDPYKPYYETYSPTIIAGRSTHDYISAIGSEFNSLVIGGQFRTRVRNYNGNVIGLDNNSMDFEILCNSGSINVKNLTEGTTVSATTSGVWVGKQLAHLSPPVVTGPSYTSWNGRTGYAAIRIPTITGGHVYGWLRIKVRADGNYAELTTFGLNPDVGKSIEAKVAVPNLVYSSDRFLESEKNNGTIGNDITVDLKDATFATSGTLKLGTHYTIQNVPEGLIFKASVVNSRQLKLSMEGVAKASDWGQYNGFVKNIKLELKNAAFSNGVGAQVEFKEFPLNVEYIGNAFSKEVSPINRYVSGSTPANGGWVVVMPNTYSIENTAFGYMFQDYNNKFQDVRGDKLISFGREIVSNTNYEVTPLTAGTEIGPNSSWTSAREFHEERGQHMIDSESFRVWRGRTNYVGFRIQRSGRMHYGWLKLRVGGSGTTCEILEFGIQGIPGASIKAGSVDSNDVKKYCDAKGSNGTEGITKVEFAGIDKSSSRDVSGYSDYTGDVGFLAQGKSYPLKVNVVGWNGGSAARVYAWFDWNNDLDFRDSGESFVLTKTTNTLGEVIVNVPSNAKLGITRMRLRVDDRVSNVDCGDTSRGEVEDYQVKIGSANATCNDGEQNGDETGIDCGGSSCEICPTCDDGIKNGDETEVDCGGPFCEPCEVYTAHCEATATGTGDGIDIVKVVFGSINKSSTGDSQYTDNSTVSTNLTKGSQVELTVTTKNTWNPTTVGVWIDWNNDNDFRDDEERVLFLQKASGTGPYSATVTVPAFAVSNISLRMRVRSGYTNELLKPCGTITSIGEVEDYRVTVGGSNPTDTQAPTIPANLTASSITSTGLVLSWTASTDNTGVAGYDIYRANTKLGTATETTYNVIGLTANTGYTFSVRAKDAAGNQSASSNTVNATTTGTTNPTPTYCESKSTRTSGEFISRVVLGTINNTSTRGANGYTDHTSISTNLVRNSANTIAITPDWASTSTYDEGYVVWIDYNQDGDFADVGEKVLTKAKSKDNPATGSFTVPNTATLGKTRMRIIMEYNVVPNDPCDSSVNYGEVEDYSVTITGESSGDTQAPSAPSNLRSTSIAQTTLTLNWTASTDNTGVTGYDVYRASTKLGTVTSTSYNVTGLTANTGYTFSVKAKDAAGNESSSSNIVSATTTGTTTPAPTYCAMKGANNNDDYITNVNFAGINNTSAKATAGYHDYTAISGNVSRGSSQNLKVTLVGWSGGGNNEVYAWFDWNRDGDFTDAGEKFSITTKTSNTIRELAINIPANATVGTTRARIVLGYNAGDGNSSCGSAAYGEVEDYNINITGGSAKSINADVPLSLLNSYPNPFNNNVTIDVSSLGKSEFTLSVYNVLGKELIRKEYKENPNKIKIGEELKATGNYLVKIKTSKKEETLRLVKIN